MPIKGLTDNIISFPRLGKIKKGSPKQENKIGKDLDYFRLDTDNADVGKQFCDLFGQQPKKIEPVQLLFGDSQDAFDCWMEEWAASGLVRRCDKETQMIHLEGNKYSRKPIPCLGEGCKCKQVGRLKIRIPDIKRIGYFEVETHSIYDIINISRYLNGYQELLAPFRTDGKSALTGVPFVLSRKTESISSPRGESKARRDASLLSIEIHPIFAETMMSALQQGALKQLSQEPISVPLLEESKPDWYKGGIAYFVNEVKLPKEKVMAIADKHTDKKAFFEECSALIKATIQ